MVRTNALLRKIPRLLDRRACGVGLNMFLEQGGLRSDLLYLIRRSSHFQSFEFFLRPPKPACHRVYVGPECQDAASAAELLCRAPYAKMGSFGKLACATADRLGNYFEDP